MDASLSRGARWSNIRPMIALHLLPVALSLLVMGAHFLRAGNMVLLAAVLVLLALLGVRRPWVARVLQLALVLGALEWARALFVLARRRVQAGEPVVRMSIILGAVAIVAALSALVFRSARVRRWYGLEASRPARRDDEVRER